MMGRLEGKRALVTGAGSGIGREVCIRFADEGATVIAADIRGQDDTASLGNGRIIAAECDVTNPAMVEALLNRCRTELGGLDILFNNAGIGRGGPRLHETMIQDWDDVIAVNVRGPFLVLKFALPLMMASGGGSIVNTASTSSFRAVAGTGAYTPSKAAIAQLTAMAALEYASDGIRVNAVAPGPIATPLYAGATAAQRESAISNLPLARMGNPREVANVVLFLASDEASFVTGSTYVVDGGRIL